LMKDIRHNKVLVTLIALVGVLALGVLASGIGGMKFRRPDPFYFEWPAASGGSFQAVAQQMQAIPIERVIVFWAVILIFTILVFFLINPRYRWKILMAVVRMAVIFILLMWALKAVANNIVKSLLANPNVVQNQVTNLDQGRLPAYAPPADIPWVTYLVTLAIVLGIVLLGWWLWNLGRRSNSGAIRWKVADIARQTLEEIADGRDFGDAVTTCYFRMVEAVNVRRGLSRQEGMTPSEFATRLEAAGLPGGPVLRLTRLFEVVRYGGKKPGEVETREAVTCLNDIIAACGGAS